MLLIDIRSTNASAAEFILYRLTLFSAGRHHQKIMYVTASSSFRRSRLPLVRTSSI